MDLEPGTQIGRYEITSRLGAGGMGEVYLARDTELGRPVAIKFLPPDVAADQMRMQRFIQEAKAASALNHPNILTIHEIAQSESGRFFVSEFVDGVTLRQRMNGAPMKLGEVLDFAIQIARALAAAHAAGIVHRDIKPENIMLRRDGYVKVLDFGLAKLTERRANSVDSEAETKALINTSPGVVMGTANYMSPEQASGKEVDARTDLWSLGVVLYEMLTGHLPFEGKSLNHVIVAILDHEPPPLSFYMAEASESLQEVISDALAKDMDARLQTAKQMLAKLQRLKQRLDAGVSLDHSVSPNFTNPSGEIQNWSGALSGAQRTITGAQRTTAHSGQMSQRETAHGTLSGSDIPRPAKKGWRRLAIVALLSSVVLAGAVFAGYKLFFGKRAGAGAPFANLQGMKLTKVPVAGKTTTASISPDGKYIVRTVYDAGKQSLRLRQVATTNEKEIIPPADDTYFTDVPTFSPDGTFIYYTQMKKNSSYGELFRVSLLGGDPQRMAFDVDSAVTISPDGKRLAFRRHVSKTNEDLLVLTSEDGSGEQVLASYKSPQGFFSPQWSPDGRVITIIVSGRDNEGYYVNLDAVSVADRTLSKVSAARWRAISSSAWLSDTSGMIVVARDRASMPSTPFQIWHISYPGGEAVKITNDLNYYQTVRVTADSNTILATRTDYTANIWVAPGSDLARAQQVTQSGTNGGGGFSWMPDGRLVYDSDASGNTDIWLTNSDGTGAKQLTFDPNTDSAPVVSPDGKYIVFYSNRAVGWGVWRINSDGSNAKELVRNISGPGPDLQVSPDSRVVYYASNDENGKLATWKVSIEGGEPTKIEGEKLSYGHISPDGRTFFTYYREPEPNAPGKILLFPAEGGAPTRDMLAPTDMTGQVDWAPDGQALDYTVVREGIMNIWRLPLAGGNPRQLTDWKTDTINHFAWSRDGKQLAFSRGTGTTDIVLIKDFR